MTRRLRREGSCQVGPAPRRVLRSTQLANSTRRRFGSAPAAQAARDLRTRRVPSLAATPRACACWTSRHGRWPGKGEKIASQREGIGIVVDHKDPGAPACLAWRLRNGVGGLSNVLPFTCEPAAEPAFRCFPRRSCRGIGATACSAAARVLTSERHDVMIPFMPQAKRATVYLEPALHRALRVKAAETDLSVSELVNNAVRAGLAEDAEDLEVFRARAKEPTSSFENLVSDLKRRGKL
jgi:hypothetical protein